MKRTLLLQMTWNLTQTGLNKRRMYFGSHKWESPGSIIKTLNMKFVSELKICISSALTALNSRYVYSSDPHARKVHCIYYWINILMNEWMNILGHLWELYWESFPGLPSFLFLFLSSSLFSCQNIFQTCSPFSNSTVSMLFFLLLFSSVFVVFTCILFLHCSLYKVGITQAVVLCPHFFPCTLLWV